MNRLLDITAASLGVLALSPVLIVIALIIRVRDGSPVLFQQQRVGQNGRLFNIMKFRTMSLQPTSEHTQFDAGNSSRVTAFGTILRKTKLDELPQLFNVVVGDMALVGPRPEVPKWVAAYPQRWEFVHQVRPGITDPASIEFRNEEETLNSAENPEKTYAEEILPRKLDLYEKYINERSFFHDISIIAKTFLELRK